MKSSRGPARFGLTVEKIRLSVIIASYNSAQTIGRCLDSLQDQMDSDDVEVIVVDSSTDGTARIVSERFPKVRLYTFSERRYPGDARNLVSLKREAHCSHLPMRIVWPAQVGSMRFLRPIA